MADFDYITVTGSPSQAINYVTYPIGMYYVNSAGVNVVITQLGLYKGPLANQSHTMWVYDTSNNVLGGGSVTVNLAGQTDGTFVYATLASPVTVTPGTAVYILASQPGSPENLYGPAGLTFTTPFGSFYPGDRQGGTLHTSYPSSPNTNYGPVTFRFSAPTIPGWTKSLVNGHYLYDCLPEQYAAVSAHADASTGDTIQLPVAGSATWGYSASSMFISKGITLDGRGTTINIASSAATFNTAGVINITAGLGSRVTGIVFQQPASAQTTAIVCSTNDNWIVDNCTYNGITATGIDPGYFIFSSVYGLYHSCTINTFTGRDEYCVIRGPSNAWTTAVAAGTANAVFGEDNIVNGPGYCDANSYGRMTQRFNTINGASSKLDGHGYSTNTPRYGVRLFEAYMNNFTPPSGSGGYASVEMRGGTVYAFFNTAANSSTSFTLVDYSYTNGGWDGFLTPYNYRLPFQIGTGAMDTANATALVAGQWAQIKTQGSTTWTAIGASSNSPGTNFIATGPGSGSGDAYVMSGSDKGYVFGNKRAGSVWPIFNGNVDPAAITLYRTQTGNPSATFVGSDVIMSNRDYFADAGAAANTGVVIGPGGSKGSAAGKLNQGYWANDEGSWNLKFTGTIAVTAAAKNYWCEVVSMGTTTVPQWQAIGAPSTVAVGTQFTTTGVGVGTGTIKPAQGRLYVSDNTNWVLSYTPYQYPHPLRSTAPVLSTASIPTAGTTLSLTWSESCTNGANGGNGVTISASGGACTATYSTGSGSITYTYNLSRTILFGETITVSYTQPGTGIQSTANQTNVATFSGASVTNNSTQSPSAYSGVRPVGTLGGGF